MAIQWRYGDRSDLSIEKLLIAESAVAQDTEEAFLGFGGGSYKKLILLDENGSLDLDIMPVGTTWIWWNDTLPSDKWVFGNTSIPTNCTKARQIWGAKTPDTPGRVIVDKSSDTEFNTVAKTGGSKEQSLRALIGAVDGDAGVIAYSATSPVPGQNNYSRGIKGEIYGGSSDVNHTTAVVRDDGNTPTTLQPYIVSRYIFKIK